MKKYTIIFALLFVAVYSSMAQIGIGTVNPHESAILEVTSLTKGFLLPRLTTIERDAINGGVFAEGLVIYNKDIDCIEFYNNTDWINPCNVNTGPDLPEPPTNIESIPTGIGSLSSRYCFDISESNDLIMGAGSLLQRDFQRADFNQVSINTQTLSFSSTNPVSNLTFYAVDTDGNIISSFTPAADYSVNGSLTVATAEIVYKSTLSSPDPDNPTVGSALGLHINDALRPVFYVVYNNQINGLGTEVKQVFSPSIRDSQCSNNQTSSINSSHFLTSTGDVYSIGRNLEGYLGDGTFINRDVLVQTILPNPIISLISGWNASFAIDNTGELYAWGDNTSGQVGNGVDGAANNQSTPVNISLPNGEKVIQIANANGNTLALSDANKIYGWGYNYGNGMLGYNETPANTINNSPVLATLPAGVTPVSIITGNNANFFFGSNGKLYSSGATQYNGRASTPTYEFKEVLFPNNINVHTVVTTGIGAMAIGLDNKIYAWGSNFYGEQGGGIVGFTGSNVALPTAVNISGMGIPTQIFKGYYTTFIIDDQNKLFATGNNDSGKLGIGSFVNQNGFIEVTLPAGVIPIKVLTFDRTIYVIAQDGKVYSAGSDSDNKLQRVVDASHPVTEFHLCTSSILTNNSIIPN